MTPHQFSAIVAAMSVLVVALVVRTGAPAVATCTGSPSPYTYQFTGTVVSTGSEGRIAQVVTADGRKVEVPRTPDASGVTSVDRTHRQGPSCDTGCLLDFYWAPVTTCPSAMCTCIRCSGRTAGPLSTAPVATSNTEP